jgi:hypothetical protein
MILHICGLHFVEVMNIEVTGVQTAINCSLLGILCGGKNNAF